MYLRYPHSLRPLFFFSKLTTMTPQTLFHSSPFPTFKNTLFPRRHRFPPHRPFFTVFCSKPTARNPPSPLRTNGYHGASHANVPGPGEVPFFVGDRTALNVFLGANFCVIGLVFGSSIREPRGEECGVAVQYFEEEVGGCWDGIWNMFAGAVQSLALSKVLLDIVPKLLFHLILGKFVSVINHVCFSAKVVTRQKGAYPFTFHQTGDLLHGCVFAERVGGKAAHSSSAASKVTPVKKKREITEEELQLEPLCDEVEGEMDKLAMEEAGFFNCVSVPDGAPPSVSSKDLPSPEEDKKYQYLWNCKDELKKATRVILATDGDPPGQALAEELARRIGKEKCWRVRWPKKGKLDNCKDANEVRYNLHAQVPLRLNLTTYSQVLMYLGPDALKEVIENAELYPIRGLFNFRDYFDEIDAYYHRTLEYEIGVPTGWSNLNDLYNVVPGELTIVTGVPNSGKSEWIDALLCNLNEIAGWKFALCSMENKVREHARKLLEKHLKKPFFNERYGQNVERMGVEEFEQGKLWLSDTFSLIRCEDDSLPNIRWVLDLAKAAVLRHGVRGLVIDPYNELDHQRPSNQTETEYVSQMLTLIKRFAQHHGCHVWFVAHPRQLHNWVGGPPNLYDISGSAHFINKCDNGIVIHRNRDPEAGPMDQVQVCVRKVRNKVAGTIGEAILWYNRTTGEYTPLDNKRSIDRRN
ncbi:unnamed protein product [Sphenostylis stenocarpa]|uniref:SF4 helicase domain-containing protein n=1 Tax=Sphenostylis stenocarpa TaxID=92480 RepID=A0AA86SNN2_9FABA|nr:unnamed protein product [Sphenostylis stenocarpa]